MSIEQAALEEATECLKAIHSLPIEHDEKGHAFKRIPCRSLNDLGCWIGGIVDKLEDPRKNKPYFGYMPSKVVRMAALKPYSIEWDSLDLSVQHQLMKAILEFNSGNIHQGIFLLCRHADCGNIAENRSIAPKKTDAEKYKSDMLQLAADLEEAGL